MTDSDSDRTPDPEGGADDSTIPATPESSDTRRLGPYVLRELLGRGGMGEVWKAEQTSPVRRTVAIKLIKAGMDSREVLVRFEAERQALALMDHPCIAKVFDAGTTPQGRPYFAMEYVQGVPVTEYCDRRRLDMRARLRLFQRICDAVQHAHQKAVLHRDLKPGNVLVADVDGEPIPKVIDFGVAKATTQKLTESTMYTAMGQLIGTPEYMSPEQADLTGEDVDTRTDVYSLGVILYELLVGALPFEPKELRKAGFEGIVRMLREQDPPRPSTRLSTLGELTTKIAESRSTAPRRLSSALKGELDWIVMRCLEKDRNRRYSSPLELRQDIERHLHLEPVWASPPSQLYRTRKFIARNRLGVTAGVLVFASVLAGAIGTTIGMFRAKEAQQASIREAEAASAVSEFLEGLFQGANPYTEKGDTLRVAELLRRGAERVDRELVDQPSLRARMLASIGDAYGGLGMPDRSIEYRERALELREQRPNEERLDLAWGRIDLASAIFWGRRYDANEVARAKEVFHRGLDLLLELVPADDPQLIGPYDGLARYYYEFGDPVSARLYLEKALQICAVHPEQDERRVTLQERLALILTDSGELDEAEKMLRELIAQRDVGSLRTSTSLARTLRAKGDYEEAIHYYTEVLDDKRSKLPPDHPDLGFELNAISISYEWMGDLQNAIDFAEQAATVRMAYGEDSAMAVGMWLRVAGLYALAGDYERAELAFGRAWPALVKNPAAYAHTIHRLNGADPDHTREQAESYVMLLRRIGQEAQADAFERWVREEAAKI